MPSSSNSLSNLKITEQDLKLERNLLKDLAADALRDYISTGHIPEGTKLTERELSQMLGISRMPVHDALMALEAEGLVVRRQGARYVIKLTEADVRDLQVARRTLEKKAAELAAVKINEDNRATLFAKLSDLEQAIAADNRHLTAKCDMVLHQIIWQQSENKYLLELLHSLLGVIYIINDRLKVLNERYDLDPDNEHRRLVELIARGDAIGASEMMGTHLDNALIATLDTFHIINKMSTVTEN